MKQWSPDPNVRGGPADYPIDVVGVRHRAADVQRRRRLDGALRRRLAAPDAVRLPRQDARRRRRRLAAHVRGARAVLRPHRPRGRRRRASRATRPTRQGADLPLPPLPLGGGVMDVVRAHDRLGWHWWPAPSAILSAPVRGAPPVRAVGLVHAGLPGGREGVDRRHALAAGDRARSPRAHGRARRPGSLLGRGRPRHGRRVRRRGRRTAPRRGRRRRARGERDRHARGCCSLSAGDGVPGRAREHERPRRAAADDAPVRGRDRRLRRARSRRGGATSARASTRSQFYETDERRGFVRGAKWSLAPSTGGPMNAAMPARAGAAVWGAEHHAPRAGALRPLPELGHLRRGPARRAQPRHARPGARRRDAACRRRRVSYTGVGELAAAARLPRRAGARVAARGRRARASTR